MAITIEVTKGINSYHVLAMACNLDQETIAQYRDTEDYPHPSIRQLTREVTENVKVRVNIQQSQRVNSAGNWETYGIIDQPELYYEDNVSDYEEIVASLSNYYSGTQTVVFSHSTGDKTPNGECDVFRNDSSGLIKFSLYGRRIDTGEVQELTNGRRGWITKEGKFNDHVVFYNDTVRDRINNISPGNILDNAEILMQRAQIEANVKIFKTTNGAIAYLTTGDDSDQVDGPGVKPETPASDRIKTLYYNSTVYSKLYNDSVVNRVGPSSINIQIQYKTNEGELIINPNRAICGYVNTDNEPNNTTYFGNIHWLVKQGVKIIETNTNRISGASSTYTGNIPSWDESTGFNGTYIDGNTIYESKYNTNMYIFANRADAEAYLAGQDPKPIGGGSGGFNPDGFIGDETSYNIQTNDVTNDMSSCWILSKAQLNELALIFSTGVNYVADDAGEQLGAVIESSMRSFIAHGEPIDMVCDLFYLPINPTEFANVSSGQIEIARDQMSLLGTVQQIDDEFGNSYSVKKSIGLDIALGPAASAAYSLGEIKNAVSSVIGSGETSNKFNVRNSNIQ